jgi:hypothetical protein
MGEATSRDNSLQAGLTAGLLYAVGMFAMGFIMGGVRLFLLLPVFGELSAVAIELPIMLGLSWLLCGRAITRQGLSRAIGPRLVMAMTAFGTLMLLDFILGMVLFGNSAMELIARWATPAGALGLAGQIVFGLFPLIRLRR